MQKCTSCEQKHTGDMISDVNRCRYALAVSRRIQGTARNVNETKARAVSRNVKATISDSQDPCILTDCGECGVNDASGEQATRTLNIFMEWAIRGQTSSVMSRARPVKTVNPPPPPNCQTLGH